MASSAPSVRHVSAATTRAKSSSGPRSTGYGREPVLVSTSRSARASSSRSSARTGPASPRCYGCCSARSSPMQERRVLGHRPGSVYASRAARLRAAAAPTSARSFQPPCGRSCRPADATDGRWWLPMSRTDRRQVGHAITSSASPTSSTGQNELGRSAAACVHRQGVRERAVVAGARRADRGRRGVAATFRDWLVHLDQRSRRRRAVGPGTSLRGRGRRRSRDRAQAYGAVRRRSGRTGCGGGRSLGVHAEDLPIWLEQLVTPRSGLCTRSILAFMQRALVACIVVGAFAPTRASSSCRSDCP